MTDAVKNYISRVDAVSNLLPVTILSQGTAIDEEAIHIFARTRSVPYVFYYRSFHLKSSRKSREWKPWEKMEVDIQYHEDPDAVGQGGVYLIPVVVGGRLMVFTPQIVKQVEKVEVERKDGNDTIGKKVECYEIKLGWSEYRNGKWMPKQVSSEAVRVSQSELFNKIPDHASYMAWKTMRGLEIRYFRFSLISCTAEGAEITVSLMRARLGYRIGRFQFKNGCCTVIQNETWDVKDTPLTKSKESLPQKMVDRWMGAPDKHAEYEFDMEVKTAGSKSVRWVDAKEMSRDGGTVVEANCSVSDNPPILIRQTDPAETIPLTHETSSGLLTHTNASATLDDVYNHLQPTKSTEATQPATPLNELETPFGLYDWELGLHAPMLLMDKLTCSQQYDKALEIARFVFNPMASGEEDSTLLRVWKWAPFREISARRSFNRILSPGGPSYTNQVDPKQRTRVGKMVGTMVDSQLGQALRERCETVMELFRRICDSPVGGSPEPGKLRSGIRASNTFDDLKKLVASPWYTGSSIHRAPMRADYEEFARRSVTKVIHVVCDTGTEEEAQSITERVWYGCLNNRMEDVRKILDPHLLATVAITKVITEVITAALKPNSSDKDISEFLRGLSPNAFNTQVDEWRNSKFQPHVVARGRPVAYMTWMVMRYIKILIAAGDQLFRRETMESMPLAIQYYTMAAHLYGPPIQEIPKHTKTTPKTFNSLINQWDAFSNAMVTFENAFPFTNSVGLTDVTDNPGFTMGYFCVPRNPAIRDLRTQIDDRLFKIRHCQDINGVTRKLALWEPPTDPRVFVRAAAAGLSLSSVMNSISGPMPNYRFQYLLRGALELVQELKSLAGAFLSAKEKMDSEAYQRIRAGHESTINAMLLDMKKLSRDEAISAKGNWPISLIVPPTSV